jgi:hypothetical protein
MRQRVLVDEAIEVLFQFTGDFDRATRAGMIDEPWGAFVGKALHPFA